MLLLYVTLSVSAILVVMYLSRRDPKNSDPYGDFHLVLNKTENDAGRPSTEWLNMGYWKNENIFPKACEALALLLCKSAQIRDGDDVLDVGHGCGDSLLLLLAHRDVPRLGSLRGITSLPAHYHQSQARVGSLLSESAPAARTPVELFQGDAVWRDGRTLTRHPLSPDSRHEYDVIMALDCAYHFNTRRKFLEQSFARLRPGGRIALADICFDKPPSSVIKFLLSAVLHAMPRENIQSKVEYFAALRDSGYTEVMMEDITEDVFPGFARYLSTQNVAFKLLGRGMGVLQTLGVRFIITTGTHRT